MHLTRRSFLKAGVAAGAAMVMPSAELFAQGAP
ncbi:MAG: twin-arginine translocation signal domain-containing protein, partial [Candidatus Binatia bacterium]